MISTNTTSLFPQPLLIILSQTRQATPLTGVYIVYVVLLIHCLIFELMSTAPRLIPPTSASFSTRIIPPINPFAYSKGLSSIATYLSYA